MFCNFLPQEAAPVRLSISDGHELCPSIHLKSLSSTHLPEAIDPNIFSDRLSLLITMWVVPTTQLVVELGAHSTLCCFKNLAISALSSSEYPDRMNIFGGEGVGPENKDWINGRNWLEI